MKYYFVEAGLDLKATGRTKKWTLNTLVITQPDLGFHIQINLFSIHTVYTYNTS